MVRRNSLCLASCYLLVQCVRKHSQKSASLWVGVLSEPGEPETRDRQGQVLEKHIGAVNVAYTRFRILRVRSPTVRELFLFLRDSPELDWPFSMTTLYTTMIKNGYSYSKKKTAHDVMRERAVSMHARQRFRAEIHYAIENDIDLNWQDESCLNQNEKRLYEMTNLELNKEVESLMTDEKHKSGKGPRVILCALGGSGNPHGYPRKPNGETSFLVARGSSSNLDGDYHADMDAEKFLRWMEDHVKPCMPDAPKRFAIVLDHATYHRKLTPDSVVPRSNATKDAIVDYLKRHKIRIPIPEGYKGPHVRYVPYAVARKGPQGSFGCTRVYLLKIVRENEVPPKYMVEEMLKEWKKDGKDGYIIWLPKCHQELNAKEYMWNRLKSRVRLENHRSSLAYVEQLILQEAEKIGPEEWRKCEEHVLKVLEQYNDEIQMDDSGAFDQDVLPAEDVQNESDFEEF